MSLKEVFLGFLGEKRKTKNSKTFIDEIELRNSFKEFSIELAIDKIAKAISMCEFVTYENFKEVKKDNYYKFNVSPNFNQKPFDFYKEIIKKAFTEEDGALVLIHKENYLIAEEFEIKERDLLGNQYKKVMIGKNNPIELLPEKGQFWDEKDVLRFKITDEDLRSHLQNALREYTKLISGAIKNYNRNNATKVVVKIDSIFDQLKQVQVEEDGKITTEYDLTLDDLFTNRLKGYMSEKDSATPIENGLEIEDKSNAGGKYKNENTRDITAVMEDMLNLAADTFGIPRGLLKGDVADVEAMTDNFITFCINPIAQMFQDEINRKIYSKKEYLNGDKVVVKTDLIKNYDLTKVSSSAEALFRIAAINVNYVRRILKEPRIEESWADDYALTKNYTFERESVKNGKN